MSQHPHLFAPCAVLIQEVDAKQSAGRIFRGRFGGKSSVLAITQFGRGFRGVVGAGISAPTTLVLGSSSRLLCIFHTTESHASRTIVTRSHEQQLSMLIVPDMPAGSTRWNPAVIVIAPAQDRGTRMFVDVFIGPLPHVADHVDDPKWTGAIGMRIHIAGGASARPLSGIGARLLGIGPPST